MPRGSGLADQEKLAYLQERVKEAKRSERRGNVISIFGLILATFSFLFPLIIRIVWSLAAYLPLFFGIIGGILIIVWGMAISINYAIQGGVLMEELRRMAQKELDLPHFTMNGNSKY
jgi:Flp pilus assembly protein TadB